MVRAKRENKVGDGGSATIDELIADAKILELLDFDDLDVSRVLRYLRAGGVLGVAAFAWAVNCLSDDDASERLILNNVADIQLGLMGQSQARTGGAGGKDASSAPSPLRGKRGAKRSD